MRNYSYKTLESWLCDYNKRGLEGLVRAEEGVVQPELLLVAVQARGAVCEVAGELPRGPVPVAGGIGRVVLAITVEAGNGESA